jgi:hypothetical protein
MVFVHPKLNLEPDSKVYEADILEMISVGRFKNRDSELTSSWWKLGLT